MGNAPESVRYHRLGGLGGFDETLQITDRQSLEIVEGASRRAVSARALHEMEQQQFGELLEAVLRAEGDLQGTALGEGADASGSTPRLGARTPQAPPPRTPASSDAGGLTSRGPTDGYTVEVHFGPSVSTQHLQGEYRWSSASLPIRGVSPAWDALLAWLESLVRRELEQHHGNRVRQLSPEDLRRGVDGS